MKKTLVKEKELFDWLQVPENEQQFRKKWREMGRKESVLDRVLEDRASQTHKRGHLRHSSSDLASEVQIDLDLPAFAQAETAMLKEQVESFKKQNSENRILLLKTF